MDEKRSEEEQKRRDALVDSLTPVQVISTMVDMFGINRTIALIGWAIRWGLQGVEAGPEFRAKCLAEGVSRATAYRASLDYRRIGDKLEERYGVHVSSEGLHDKLVNSALAPYCLNV